MYIKKKNYARQNWKWNSSIQLSKTSTATNVFVIHINYLEFVVIIVVMYIEKKSEWVAALALLSKTYAYNNKMSTFFVRK